MPSANVRQEPLYEAEALKRRVAKLVECKSNAFIGSCADATAAWGAIPVAA